MRASPNRSSSQGVTVLLPIRADRSALAAGAWRPRVSPGAPRHERPISLGVPCAQVKCAKPANRDESGARLAPCLDNARSGRIDEGLNSSHDWRSRGIDHGGVLSDRRAERLGPGLR
jgi:hypothetical protein